MGPDASINLLLDLDDTLIRNAERYAQVKESVARHLQVLAHDALPDIEDLIHCFDRREQENINFGRSWGSENFRVSLMQEAHRLLGYGFYLDRVYAYIDKQVEALRQRPVELIEGVAETIAELKARGYRLYLITKGDRVDQNSKIAGLGIAHLFDGIEIMAAKEPENYRHIIEKIGLLPGRTFVVGNSPKHDVNAAIQAGLRAILIPRAPTFRFDEQEIMAADRDTLVLESFSDLLLQRLE